VPLGRDMCSYPGGTFVDNCGGSMWCMERIVGDGRPVSRKTGIYLTKLIKLGDSLAPRGRDSGKRLLPRALPMFVLSVSTFTLFTGVACAAAPKLIFYGGFSLSVKEVALVEEVEGVSVDQSSGDLYLGGFDNGVSKNLIKLQPSGAKFEPSAKELSPPSPFGEGDGIYEGIRVNPSNGDLYVLEGPNFSTTLVPKLATYDSTGALVGTPFPVPSSRNIFVGFASDVQIASDSTGNVYLPVTAENEVLEYSPTGVLLSTFTGGPRSGALNRPTGVAVDSTGHVWVADTGNHRIEELSPADEPLREIKTGGEFNSHGEGVESIALDNHGDVFAIVDNKAEACGSVTPPCSHLVEYNSSTGVQLADVGAGLFEGGGQGNSLLHPMVAVNEASGRVYVTDNSNKEVWIYGPPTVAVVGKELTAEVGASEAKLGALVNPGGTETTYRFEYGTTTAYGQSVPFPEGSVGEGLTPHAVWAAASDLAPDTTYHYRIVATSEVGSPVAGRDQTFTTASAEQSACPNEASRGGFSAKLPDCRAYELVTPPNTSSVEFDSGLDRSAGVVAGDGEAISLLTKESLPGAPTGGDDYVATRGRAGWNVEDISPLEAYTGALCVSHNTRVPAYSNEISKDIVILGESTRASQPENKEACNAEGLQVVSGEPVGYQNLLLRDNATGAYQLINTPPPGVTPADAHFLGASADLSHVVFGEKALLTPDALALAVEGSEDVYEWDEGALRLLTLLPGGTPAAGALAEAAQGANPISADGSHIFFASGGALYVRIDGERTIQVDRTQGAGASGDGSFQAASADGSKIFFLDESRLTPDSTAQLGEPDLYECALPEGANSCELSDLTVATGGEHADVLRVSVLGSKDSSHVYFVARAVLATNKREYTDSEGKVVLEGATSGQHNLYLWSGGTTTYIATLDENDFGAGNIAPDGTWFAFDSLKSLTGYDNSQPGGGEAEEVFLYSASSNQLVCASCNPTGEAPVSGGTKIPPTAGPRYLSDGGRLFFETGEALLPSDTNGQSDVYEYESGQPSLISSGTSTNPSSFIGAGESGGDVLFTSSQQLVPQDTQEGMQVIYDARVGGGFPAASPPPPCATADACRNPVSPQPPIYGAPSSQTFAGAGNLAPPPITKAKSKQLTCKKDYVKKKIKGKARCVRKPRSKARKSSHAKRKGK
jgi:hypothetical protein